MQLKPTLLQLGTVLLGGRYAKPSVIAPNQLEQQFDVEAPNQAWVMDITYIRTHEGWLYLAVVLDLFSRQVIGWSMQSRMDRDLALTALLMAIWRRPVISDQGPVQRSRLAGVPAAHNSLSASDELPRQLPTTQLLRASSSYSSASGSGKDLYRPGRARRDVFNYIELFYNPKRRHGYMRTAFSGRVRKAVFQLAAECH